MIPNVKAGNKHTELPVMHKEIKHPLAFLIAILLIGFFLRVYISFFTELPHIHRDTADYLKQADAILNGSYINYFPNGYPLIIAFLKIFFTNNIETVLVWLNILLATATIYITYLISRRLFNNEFLALTTALLLAVLPTQLNTVRWVISEGPTCFFLISAYWLYLRQRFIWAGLLLGFSTLIRTEMLLIFGLLILCEMIWLRKINMRLIVAFFIPLLMLGYYCYDKTGKFSISGHSKVNIAYSITAAGHDIDWAYIDNHPEIKTEKDAINKYIEHMTEEPGQYIKERMMNFWELWGIPSNADGNRSNLERFIMASGNFFMIFFGFACWWMNRRNFNVLIMIIPFIVVTVVHVLMLATPRYTFPVEPFMIILATWMLLRLFVLKRTPAMSTAG